MPQQNQLRRGGWILVLTGILLGFSGCERPTASQSSATSQLASATSQEPVEASAAVDLPPPEIEVQPASHQTESEKSFEGQPPADDGPPRRSAIRPKADRGRTSSGVEKITFDDLILGMQADIVYRPWMLESETNGGRAKELEGKKVRLAGVMHGGVETQTKLKEFVLLRNIECKYGPQGQADHLAKVFLEDGKTTKYAGFDTVVVEGTLKIEPEMGDDGNTWSIYRIDDAEVK